MLASDAMNWNKGDVVQLKSGGPIMTVTDIYSDGSVGCTWFIKDELRQGSFPAQSLDRYKPHL